MSGFRQLLGMGACAAFVVSCGSAPQIAMTHEEQQATLDNGLKLIVMPDTTTPLVQVDVRYEVGQKEDPPGKAGLAHLVEHMMFQHRFGAPETPIEQRPPSFEIIPHMTVGFNAYTNWDTTHYFLIAPKEDLEGLIRLEAARMATGCDTIPPEEFEREREVVRNEIRQRTGTPDGQQYQMILDAVYPEGHAYREMMGGNDKQLTNIVFDDVCKFMKDYYLPSRATVLVSGNVDVDEVGILVSKYFRGIEKRTPAPLKEVAPIDLKHKTVEKELDLERDTVHVVFQLPPRNTDEFQSAAQLLFTVTGIMDRFGEDWDFSDGVGVDLLGGAYAPILDIFVEVRPGKSTSEALSYMWKAVNMARRYTGVMLEDGTFTQEKITKILYKQSIIEEMEPLRARNGRVADMIQFDPDIEFGSGENYIFALMDKIDKLDQSKHESTVKKILDKDKAVVFIAKANKQGVKGDKRSGLKFSSSAHGDRPDPPVDPREAFKPLLAPKSNSILPDAERYELSNGMKVVLLPYQGLPVVHADLVFSAGSVHEDPGKSGLASVAARFLRMPMGANAYGRTGVSVYARAGAEYTTVSARGMSPYLNVIIKGLDRLVKAGEINQESIEDYRDRFKRNFERPSYQREYLYNMEWYSALFGKDHPYTTTGDPTPETLGRIGRDAAMGFIRKHYSAKNATLVVAGNFDVLEAKKHIDANFGGWSGGHKDEPVTTKTPDRSGPDYFAVLDRDEAPQVRVSIGYPAPAGIDGQQGARLVLSAMLNERMGLVREQLGSTYGAYGGRRTRLGPTAYEMGGNIDAPRAGESIKFMREQIDKLRKGEDFERDFAVARRLVLKNLMAESTESYSLAGRLGEIARYGLEPDYHERLARFVAAVSPAQVKALMAAELDPSKEVIGMMGGRAYIDKATQEAGLDKVRIIEAKESK